ncbi:MAG TPA: hypothetical protein VF516_10930 [Kofleriaceae bacterium]
MRLGAVMLVAGCATTPDPYAVGAIAPLQPVGTPAGAEAGIDGPIEVLGSPAYGRSFQQTFAAYKVHVPEGAAPWVRVYRTPSCTPVPESPALFDDLGAIRRVGGETHFFAPGVQVAGRIVDIDTRTVTAPGSLDPTYTYGYLIGMIAVVQAPGDPAAGGGPDDPPAGGPWLACGAFEIR